MRVYNPTPAASTIILFILNSLQEILRLRRSVFLLPPPFNITARPTFAKNNLALRPWGGYTWAIPKIVA